MSNYILRGNEFGFNTYYIEDESKKLGSNITVVKTEDHHAFTKDDIIFRWGTKSKVPNGPHIINKIEAMTETCNKGLFRKKAAEKGLAPATFTSVQAFLEWTDKQEVVGPVIVRPQFHSRSEGLYFCKDKKELDKAIDKCGADYYISQYINKTQEFRVFVAQGRAFIVAEKNHKNKNDISWGCVDEGTLDYIEWEYWPEEVVRVAIESFNLSKLHFAAIDIMVKDGKAYFLECNTAPEVWAYYGKKFAQVFTWMVNNHSKRIKAGGYDNWKKCAHPALSELVEFKNEN